MEPFDDLADADDDTAFALRCAGSGANIDQWPLVWDPGCC
jgi:hypothetical protein